MPSDSVGQKLNEPARTIPVVAETDVVVLGGGPAGIAAATAAARQGARTMLLERYGFLGGQGTAAMVTNFCGLHVVADDEIIRVIRGIADDLLDRLDALDALKDPHFVPGPDGAMTAAQSYDTAAFKSAADDLLLSAGVDLRFHVLAVDAMVDDGKIDALIIETKSGRAAIRAHTFIDCSGDADLAHWAGAPYEVGDDDGFIAYPTLMFRMGDVDGQRAYAEGKPALRQKLAEAIAEGQQLPRRHGIINAQNRPQEWRANLTQVSRDGRPINGANWDDFSYAEIEGRRQVLDYFSFLKDRVPGFERAYLLETAPQVGIRETRRIVGPYQLTAEDVLGCRDFDDSIGINGWPLEIHRAGDVEWRFIPDRGWHQIPFRTLIPQNVKNLLVAGRCASTTPGGQASLRVSGPCFAMGQAAGTAAAMAVKTDEPVADTSATDLQTRLTDEGVVLHGNQLGL